MGIVDSIKGIIKPKKEMTQELGVEGDVVVGSFDQEEQRKDKTSIKDYRKMLDDDMVETLYNAVVLPIISTTFDVEPDKGDVDGEQAAFIRRCLFEETYRGGMDTPFSLFITQTLKSLSDGFAAFEKVYRLDENQRLVYKKLAYRDATTVTIKRDNKDDYDGIKQKATFGDRSIDVDIPSYKTFLFTYGKEHDFYYGRSAFRSIWGSYDRKRKMEYFDMVSIQSRAKRPRILKRTTESAITAGDKGDTSTRKYLRMLRRLGEYDAAGSLPYGYDIQELQADSLDANESIERQNSNMARKFLASFILLGNQGSSSVGSYALSANQSDLFMVAEKALMKLLAEHFTRYLIVDLIDLNYPVGKRFYPTFKFGDISEEMQEFIKAIFTKMIEKDKVSDDLLKALEDKVANRLEIKLSKEDNGQLADKFRKLSDGSGDIVSAQIENINLSAIEKWLDKTEYSFKQNSEPLLESFIKGVANNPDADVSLPSQYVDLVRNYYRQSYNYGKMNASDESGIKTPKTQKAEAEHLKLFMDFIIEKQTGDIKSIVAQVKGSLPIKMADDKTKSWAEIFSESFMELASVWLIDAVQGTSSAVVRGMSDGRSDAFDSIETSNRLHMWISSMEKNTCATCRSLHGTTYTDVQWNELKYRPQYVHLGCRCLESIINGDSKNYKLPAATGAPKAIDDIHHTQITTKPRLIEQGILKEGSIKAEYSAVQRYQSWEYRAINSYIASGASGNVDLDSVIKQIDKVMSKSILDKDLTVYRGLSLNNPLSVGDVFNERSYVSTSRLMKSAANFADSSDGDYKYIMKITVPSGAHALDMNQFLGDKSLYATEYELLLNKPKSYIIESMEDGANNTKLVNVKLTDETKLLADDDGIIHVGSMTPEELSKLEAEYDPNTESAKRFHDKWETDGFQDNIEKALKEK